MFLPDSVLPLTVLLLTLVQCQAQDPSLSMSFTATTLRSGAMFYLNCTVTPYNAAWNTEVYKTKFQVTTPAGTKYMVGNESTPHSIAINGDVNAELKTMEGDRYMAMHMGSEQDNMTKTTVVINSTKPEDSGLWGCRVWKAGDIIKNSTAIVNLQVDGPVRYVKIYANATPGGTVFPNQTLSDGVTFAFMDGQETKVTCEVGVPSSTGPEVKVMLGDDDISEHFKKSEERSTSEPPKAGGLVMHTAHIPYVNAKFSPSIKDHGKAFYCDVSLQHYSNVNASFTLNVESKPHIVCPALVAAPIEMKETSLKCTIMANPPVTSDNVQWNVPEAVTNENLTVTHNASGINYTLTVKITHLTQAYYGDYNITATNVHGTTVHKFKLLDRIVSSDSSLAYPAIMATVLSLALALILQR